MTISVHGQLLHVGTKVYSWPNGSHSHFLKDDLPRIRYANPKIDIQVNKLPKTRDETWEPELVLEFCPSPFTSKPCT